MFYQYIETLELSGFVSITSDNRNDAAVLNLQIKDRSIKLSVRKYIKPIHLLYPEKLLFFFIYFLLFSVQVPNAEMHELWKGYIRSVAEVHAVCHLYHISLKLTSVVALIHTHRVSLQLRVPPSLNLLPGQIRMLTEAVEKEKERLKNISPPADNNNKNYVCLQGDMPA